MCVNQCFNVIFTDKSKMAEKNLLLYTNLLDSLKFTVTYAKPYGKSVQNVFNGWIENIPEDAWTKRILLPTLKRKIKYD